MFLVNNVIRSATRNSEDTLRCIVLCRENEHFLSTLSKANCELYVIKKEGISDWKTGIVEIPKNVYVLDKTIEESTISYFDCIIINDRLQEYDLLAQLARRLHLPIISIDHSSKGLFQKLPYTMNVNVPPNELDSKTGNIIVSTDGDIGKTWKESSVQISLEIPFYIDVEKHHAAKEKKGIVIDNNVPEAIIKLFENTLYPHKYVPEEVFRKDKPVEDVLKDAKVFINTWNSLDIKLLNAMACECVVIAPKTADTSIIIEHGKNGFLFSTLDELPSLVQKALNDNGSIGANARKTVHDKYFIEEEGFVKKWNHIFTYISNLFFSTSQ